MKTLKQKARKYFNDEMSGEPLTQEAVEEALVDFGQGKREDQLANSYKAFGWSIIGSAITIIGLIIYSLCNTRSKFPIPARR